MDGQEDLTRREREIMAVVFARGSATAVEVWKGLKDRPSRTAPPSPRATDAPAVHDQPVSRSRPWPWQSWVVLTWAAGCLLVLGRVLLGGWNLHRLERSSRRVDEGPLVERAAIAVARRSSLERRMRAILDGRRERRRAGMVSVTSAVLAAIVAMPPLAVLQAQEGGGSNPPDGGAEQARGPAGEEVRYDGSTPTGAVMARVRACRDCDVAAYEVATRPPRYRMSPADPDGMDASDEEAGLIDRYLSMITAEGGEEAVYGLLRPFAGRIGDTLLLLVEPWGGDGPFSYSPLFPLGGSASSLFFDVVAEWLDGVDFTDEVRLREAIRIACETARRTGVESSADLGELDHEAGMRLRGTLFGGCLEIAAVYGLDLRAALDSVEVTGVEDLAPDLVTVTLTYELLGEKRTATATLGRLEDGNWYEQPAGIAFVTSAVVGPDDLPLCANVLVPANDYGLDQSEVRAVDIAADGVISSSGVVLWRPELPDETDALVGELRSLASGMEREAFGETSVPTGKLLVRAHRAVRPEVIRFLVRECAREPVRIWKFQIACRGLHGDCGTFCALAPAQLRGVADVADVDLVVGRSPETGEPTYSFRVNVEPDDPRERRRLEKLASVTGRDEVLRHFRLGLRGEYSCRVCTEEGTAWTAVTELIGEYMGEKVTYASPFGGIAEVEWSDGFWFRKRTRK